MIIHLMFYLLGIVASSSLWAGEEPLRLPDSIMCQILLEQINTTKLHPSEVVVRDTMIITALRLRKFSMTSQSAKRLVEDTGFTQKLIETLEPTMKDAFKREYEAMGKEALQLAQEHPQAAGRNQLMNLLAMMKERALNTETIPQELITSLSAMSIATPTSLKIMVDEVIAYNAKGRWAINKAHRALPEDPVGPLRTTEQQAEQHKLPLVEILEVNKTLDELKIIRDEIAEHMMTFEVVDPVFKRYAPRAAITEGNKFYARTKLSRNPFNQ